MRDAALAAIAGGRRPRRAQAGPRSTHAGDRSPLALANREIGALPPQARKDAGHARRPGPRRGQPGARRPAARCSRPSTRSGCWSRRPSTSRCRGDRAPQGARHPLTTLQELDRRRLRGDGLGGRRGPRGRGRVAELRRAQPRPRPPGAHHAGHLLARARRRRPGAAHAHLAGAGAHHARRASRRSTSSAPAGCSAPTSSTRRTPRSSTRSRGSSSTRASRWPTSRAPSTTSPTAMFGDGITTRFRPSYFPFTEPSRRGRPGLLRLPRPAAGGRDLPHLQGRGLDRVGRLRRGQPAGAASPAASTPRPTPASPSAWASSGR